jgi:hypothetical protein
MLVKKVFDGSYVYHSKEIEKFKTVLVLVQGSGGVRAGLWARSVCLKENLTLGSMIP